MHKVTGDCGSCTCRISEHICSSSSSGGAQEKGKTGSKEDEIEIGRKCISEFDPALSPLEG